MQFKRQLKVGHARLVSALTQAIGVLGVKALFASGKYEKAIWKRYIQQSTTQS